MNKEDLLYGIESIKGRGGIIGIILLLVLGLYTIYKLVFSGVTFAPLIFAAIPLSIVIFSLMIKYYHRIFYLLFLSHFLVLLVSSVTDLKIGVVTLSLNLAIVILILIISFYQRTSWKSGYNGMLIIFLVWMVYCILELANPNMVPEAWGIAAANYFIYPIVCAILVPITIRRYRNIEWLLIIWSIFIILAAAKGYYQKNYGFTHRELVFLFEQGAAKTHIIWSGIRYFSFFTDAANYGVHMAMAVLGFGVSAYFVKSKWMKIYFVIIALLAAYGMFISGTRAAISVPIGGLIMFTIISQNKKTLLIGLVVLLGIFIFFRGTTIGEGNPYIRKMRSAFSPQTDASFQVRVENRELMKEYMAGKPFGYGIGLGGKADRFNPKELMPIPPDSWLVNVWTDTGIVGLSIYIILHIVLFAWCSWILMFKIASKRLRNLLSIWLCINAGFFIAAYANDVMQYPSAIIIYTGFAICFAAPNIEKEENKYSLNITDNKNE